MHACDESVATKTFSFLPDYDSVEDHYVFVTASEKWYNQASWTCLVIWPQQPTLAMILAVAMRCPSYLIVPDYDSVVDHCVFVTGIEKWYDQASWTHTCNDFSCSNMRCPLLLTLYCTCGMLPITILLGITKFSQLGLSTTRTDFMNEYRHPPTDHPNQVCCWDGCSKDKSSFQSDEVAQLRFCRWAERFRNRAQESSRKVRHECERALSVVVVTLPCRPPGC